MSSNPNPEERNAASERLHQTLVELVQELEQTSKLDDTARSELAEVAERIRLRLGKSAGDVPSGDLHGSETPESLNQMAVEFSASHPRLARLVENVAEALAGIGI